MCDIRLFQGPCVDRNKIVAWLSRLARPVFLAGLQNKLYAGRELYIRKHKDCLYPAKELTKLCLIKYLYHQRLLAFMY